MIRTFANKATAAVFASKFVNSLPHEIQRAGLRRLRALDAAVAVEDLRAPPSNRLEALMGDRKGQWSIRINDKWRVCFHFDNGDAYDVEIADYH
ncbi:type II toxin-antitoxin system RelE/ParE family toxin [Cupriavidus sp. CV2]|uniref:type II toxin-antitoxin system RelE/ParE family toxin n=1 Tax=Cupriavidus ulmosensis TaxID=3065913 RepID=UPI00296B14DF|nr:type II toxin-antitoxin system RelE/ParE family toxin [Cupriavidus sp. CV2]MDW3688426.1 type II toxin-antitoxin system RelE/ParE family toxin [Cupriavidus sp. CV2]